MLFHQNTTCPRHIAYSLCMSSLNTAYIVKSQKFKVKFKVKVKFKFKVKVKVKIQVKFIQSSNFEDRHVRTKI